jgi:biotin synthase
MPSSPAANSQVPAPDGGRATDPAASADAPRISDPALAAAIDAVLATGVGLAEPDVLAVLNLPDEELPAVLAAAHRVRMAWCGPEVEVEGIVSVKTGGCPEDCHFCSQSGVFSSPVRAVWLDIPALVEAAKQTAATGATEFCIVAAVRGPDERLMAQMRAGVAAIRAEVDIQVAASLGMLTQAQVDELAAMGVHRYNHNLETARSFFPNVVTTHTWQERFDTLRMVREAGMEVCCGGILGLGESVAQRAEFAAQLATRVRARRWGTPRRWARRTRCAPSPRSGSPCRGPSCGTRAGASSRSATWVPATDCSAASTPSSSATT